MKRILGIIVVLLVLVAAYLLLAPTPVQPVAWSPKPQPSMSDGVYAVNDKLKALERIAQIDAVGPEAIAVDSAGRIYTGYLDGRVARFEPDGSGYTLLAETGGRPLGLAFVPGGGLVVADARKGLLLVQEGSPPQLLTDSAEGVRFGFADDVDVEKLGDKVYFSDASSKWGFGQHMEDIIEHGGNGRLLRYDPATKETSVLLKGLHFANGVAVGPDDAFVLVNETAEYRVVRYWLKGDKAGTSETFVDNLPCFPDNITYSGTGRFWLACAAPRDALLDKLAGNVFMRKVITRLPAAAQPKPKRHGMAFGLDLDGKVIANLQYAAPDAFSPVTSVREFGDWLYFGSLSEKSIGRLPLKAALTE
jgi:sugar lactone lactonase YvrE